MYYSGGYNPREARRREKGKWGKEGERAYIGDELATASQENPSSSQLCGKFSEKPHREAPAMPFLIHHCGSSLANIGLE